jgi:hypothetical protein
VAALGPVAKAVKVEVVDTVDSTSSELDRRSAREDVHRRLLIAEWQTAGRGRRGRGWTAVAGGSLTFSLGWRFEQGAGFLAGLSLGRRRGARARTGRRGHRRRRAQMAERPHSSLLQVRRHPDRALPAMRSDRRLR